MVAAITTPTSGENELDPIKGLQIEDLARTEINLQVDEVAEGFTPRDQEEQEGSSEVVRTDWDHEEVDAHALSAHKMTDVGSTYEFPVDYSGNDVPPASDAILDDELGDDQFIHLHARARRPSEQIQDMISHMQLDEMGALQMRVEYLEDVNKVLAESAAAKDIEVTRQNAEILKLQERIAGMERLIEVGADRLHYFAEQRDASLKLLRKVIAEGKQIEIARHRLWALLMDGDVTKEHKAAMREIVLTGDAEEIMKIVCLVERKHQHREGAASAREDESAHEQESEKYARPGSPHEDCQDARGDDQTCEHNWRVDDEGKSSIKAVSASSPVPPLTPPFRILSDELDLETEPPKKEMLQQTPRMERQVRDLIISILTSSRCTDPRITTASMSPMSFTSTTTTPSSGEEIGNLEAVYTAEWHRGVGHGKAAVAGDGFWIPELHGLVPDGAPAQSRINSLDLTPGGTSQSQQFIISTGSMSLG